MIRIFNLLLRLFTLGAIFIVAVVSIPGGEDYRFAFAFSLSGLLFITGLTLGFKASGVLGFFIVLSPMFGRGSLYLSWASFLIGQTIGDIFENEGGLRKRIDENSSRELLILSTFCFTVIFLLGVRVPIRLDFDLWTTLDVIHNGGFGGFQNYWSVLNSSTARALVVLSGYLLIFLHISAQVVSLNLGPELRQLFKGLALGLVASIGVLLGQSQSIVGILAGNYSDYWRILKQYPAAATDPNALAISTMLIFPIISTLYSTQRVQILLLFCLTSLGLFSGSRTFILGIFLSSALILFQRIRRFERSELNWLFAVGLSSVLLAAILLGQPNVNRQLQEAMPFPAVVRVLKSVNWQERSSMFSSRIIFSQVALATWEKSPIIGVGLERFFDNEEAVMDQLGIDLRGFTDNANNFYLQVLSESGILGLSLFILSISLLIFITSCPSMEDEEPHKKKLELAGSKTLVSLQRQITYPTLQIQTRARLTLVVFLLLLVTGAHLLSPEVQFITASLLLASFSRPALIRRSIMQQIRVAVIFSLFIYSLGNLLLAGSTYPTFRTQGFYPPESVGEPLTRWSGSHARIVVCNTLNEDTIKFQIKSLKPNSVIKAQEVVIHEGDIDHGDTTQRFELSNNEWTDVMINLRPDREGKFSNAVINLTVSNLWSPSSLHIGSDPRWLGVLVNLPKNSC